MNEISYLLLDESEGVATSYKVINKIPCKSLKGLNSSIYEEIKRVKKYLGVTDPSKYDSRYRQLRPPYYPKYEAYVGNRGMRIMFEVNTNSHIITLIDIKPRSKLLNI